MGLLKGAEAMYFKGSAVPCTENISEGWYYDEKSKELITQQQFEDNREKYEPPKPSVVLVAPETPETPFVIEPEIGCDLFFNEADHDMQELIPKKPDN